MLNKLKRGGNCLIKSKTDKIVIALSWQTENNREIELDTSSFLLNKSGKVRDDQDFVFYNQPDACNGEVSLDRSPKNPNHDSEVHIHLSKIPKEISKISIVATIYQGIERQQNFSMLDQVLLKIAENEFNGQEIVSYELEAAHQEVALILGEIYRNKDAWKFRAIGQGFNDGLDVLASRFGVNIEGTSEESHQNSEGKKAVELRRTRRSTKQILAEKTHALQKSINEFLPQINSAVEQKINESNTRMILDKIFMESLGYKIDEIKAEQKIQGRKADYVLSVDNDDMLVVEAKRAGMRLQNKQIFQATSYGAYSGIKWALLTNLQIWQLYYISTQEKVEPNLVFSIDLTTDLTQEDFEKFILISRYGINKKRLLEKLWNEVNALSHENIISTMISEEVINKIRTIIKRDTGCNLENEKIQQSIEEILRIN
jgi:stress response protein SCP2/predicted type IV restriction endonuclease